MSKKSKNNFSLSTEQYLKLYYFMRLTREFEESILKLYRQGKIVGGAYTGNGNEATGTHPKGKIRGGSQASSGGNQEAGRCQSSCDFTRTNEVGFGN